MANVRWNLAVSEDVDRSVRVFLAERGGKKGGLSDFVEKAVAWQMLRDASAQAKAATSHIPEDEMMELIDEALEWARHGEGSKLNARRP
jgi:Ribbon-helix-helix domain